MLIVIAFFIDFMKILKLKVFFIEFDVTLLEQSAS